MSGPVLNKAKGPRVIVALDYDSSEAALHFVNKVTPAQCRLKVGVELFAAGGPTLVDAISARGFDVFLDLKFHDIPNTVARACRVVARLGVWMLDAHTLGGLPMLEAARAALDATARRPLLIGVTVLTSQSQRDIERVGLRAALSAHVDALAGLAHAAGLDGVVCSPKEVTRLRAQFSEDFVLVTPGIRPHALEGDDQAHTLTPPEALAAGADYLVIGRPITQAPDPVAALDAINRTLDAS